MYYLCSNLLPLTMLYTLLHVATVSRILQLFVSNYYCYIYGTAIRLVLHNNMMPYIVATLLQPFVSNYYCYIWYSRLLLRCYINLCIVARILQLCVANYCFAALAIQCVSNYSSLVRLPRDQSLTIKFCTAPIGNAFICNCDCYHNNIAM